MRWQEIYDLGVGLDVIETAAARLQHYTDIGSAPRGFKLVLHGGPVRVMTDVPVTIKVPGVSDFWPVADNARDGMFKAIIEMYARLTAIGAPLILSASAVSSAACAIETLMKELTTLAVWFCGEPKRPEEEPRFSLEIEADFYGSATVRLVFEDVEGQYQTSGHYRQAIFENPVGAALDGIADVLAQARAHLEARTNPTIWVRHCERIGGEDYSAFSPPFEG